MPLLKLFEIILMKGNKMGISFANPEKLTEIFDGENREEWQKTSYIINKLELTPNTVIADVGAGTGYFSNIFSQHLGNGKIYSIDCEPNMVSYLKNRFSDDSFSHVNIIHSLFADPCIPSDVDMVFVANTYRFITDRCTFLNNLFQQVKTQTRLVLVDFKGSHARVSPNKALEEVQQAGFEILNFDLTGCPDHYILTCQKGDS